MPSILKAKRIANPSGRKVKRKNGRKMSALQKLFFGTKRQRNSGPRKGYLGPSRKRQVKRRKNIGAILSVANPGRRKRSGIKYTKAGYPSKKWVWKKKRNPKNIAAGFYDEDGYFHPIRASYDYSRKRAGESKRSKRRKNPGRYYLYDIANKRDIWGVSFATLKDAKRDRIKGTKIVYRKTNPNKRKRNPLMAKTRKRRRARVSNPRRRRRNRVVNSHRRRTYRRRSNPTVITRYKNRGRRRTNRHHYHRRRNPGVLSGTMGQVVGVIGGATVTSLVSGQLSTYLGSIVSNPFVSIIATAVVATAQGHLIGKIAKNPALGKDMMVGGYVVAALQLINYLAPSLMGNLGIGLSGLRGRGMGLIAGSSFYTPQVNLPGSMGSFVVPAAIPQMMAAPTSSGGMGSMSTRRMGRLR